MADVKRVRRELSRELAAAHRKGRLGPALKTLEAEGRRALRRALKRPNG